MAINSQGYMERSDLLVFGRDFTVRTITMETVLFGYFFALPLPQNSNCGNARGEKRKGLELVEKK